jgi:hypothetical protein
MGKRRTKIIIRREQRASVGLSLTMLLEQLFLYIPMHRQSSARQLRRPSSQPLLPTTLVHFSALTLPFLDLHRNEYEKDNSISIVATCVHAKGTISR